MRVELEVSTRGLTHLVKTFEGFAKRNRVPIRIQQEVLLALDEVVSNVLRHGNARLITVEVTVGSGVIQVEVTDDSKRFNPLQMKEPETDLSIAERPIGGLGIHLVKKLMDGIEYSRHDGLNHLILRKRIRGRRRRSSRRHPAGDRKRDA